MRRNVCLLLVVVLVSGSAVSGCFGQRVASDWAYEMVGLRALQDAGLSGTGVRVAIVDTGIDASHRALAGIQIVAWADYVNEREDPYDDHGHGSHVAGILAADATGLGDLFTGLALKGAAPDVSLIVVKSISKDSTATTSDVAQGIDFAVAQDADVICLSLGSHPSPLNLLGDQVSNAVNRALEEGILVVASAGNEGTSQGDVESPSDVPGVIAVGAVDEGRIVADFSSRGSEQANNGVVGGVGARSDPNKKPEVVAPGVDIESAYKDGGYASARGTSQAAPFVCGGLALLLEDEPALRAQDSRAMIGGVKSRIQSTAEKLASQATPHDNAAGYGLFRADLLVGSPG